MAYDSTLAARIRDTLPPRLMVAEKKMFGGVAYLLNGNILVGVWKDNLIARVGPAVYEEALEEDHVVEFDVTGRPMTGWVMVEPEGLGEDQELRDWIDKALAFVSRLPGK